MQMIGSVANMMQAAWSTSGVLLTSIASDRVAFWASVAEDTSW